MKGFYESLSQNVGETGGRNKDRAEGMRWCRRRMRGMDGGKVDLEL